MGKYKQWLHHQEIGRRLRDQINTLEQERGRVQNMAPEHPTALPDLENPVISALINYTRAGNKLSDIDVIKAALPDIGADRDPGRPVPGAAMTGPLKPTATNAAPARGANEAVVASLLARAEQMPSDPMAQMQQFERNRDEVTSGRLASSEGASQAADSVGSWFQRHRQDED